MAITEARVAVVVLAAGEGRRMGAPKQLLPYRGKSLVRHAAETAVSAGLGPVVVVVGAAAEEVRAEVSGMGVEVVENERWAEGMGGSIACGVHVLGDRRDVGAVVILLCDQPLVTREVMGKLVEAWRGGPGIVVSDYGGGDVGPPVLFDRRYWGELEGLAGEMGARGVIRKHRAEVGFVAFSGGAMDVDTRADYERLEGRNASPGGDG